MKRKTYFEQINGFRLIKQMSKTQLHFTGLNSQKRSAFFLNQSSGENMHWLFVAIQIKIIQFNSFIFDEMKMNVASNGQISLQTLTLSYSLLFLRSLSSSLENGRFQF